MDILIGWIAIALVVVIYLRKWLLRREIPQKQAEPFDGELYQVGDACIARRRSIDAKTSVIVMHGFVENFLYFTEHYADPSIELILLSSAGYHVPVSKPRYQQAEWIKSPRERPGTISYDAAVLNMALENLVSTGNVRVHGHSRGGAVTLEAARQRPDLFEQVEVILEAPVLPQGKPCQEMPAPVRWLVPFFLPLWQQQPISDRNRAIWGPLDNPRKRALINGLPFNPANAGTVVMNLRDMTQWMQINGPEIYQHVKRGAILVPSADRVLKADAMLASARQAQNLQIIEIEGGSHFVVADRPESIPPLPV